MSSDPFDILRNIQILSNQGIGREINGTLTEVYLLFLSIEMIGLLVSLVVCGVKLALWNRPATREEVKQELIWKSILAVILFSFTFFASIAYNLSKTMI